MQPIYIYFIVYIVPIFLLIALATYVITHNSRALENRLIFSILLMFSITLLGEFSRHIVPFEWNPVISMYIVGLSTMIAMATILYLVYTLVQKYCALPKSFVFPMLIYSIVPLHLLMIFLGINVTVEDFQKNGIWIYRTDSLYNIWLYGAVGIITILVLYLCLYGWYRSKSARGRQLLRYLSIGSISVFLAFIFAMSILTIEYIPPNPTLFSIFITSFILAIGVTQFELTPSIKERYKTLFELTPNSIMLLNEQFDIIEINEQATNFFHQGEHKELLEFLHTSFNKKQGIKLMKRLKQQRQLKHYQLEFEHPLTLQKIILLFDATLVSFHTSQNYYITWQNITHEIEQQNMVHHLAYHDALTGIRNRISFVNSVEEILATQTEQLHAFVLIDLNYFKQINDTYGHIVGDEVLKFVANTLNKATPANTILARLGGDEFVIFYEQLEAEEELLESLETIRTRFNETLFCYENLTQSISLSIGYSLFPRDGANFEVLFHHADMAMYHDKTTIKRNLTT